MASIPLKDAQAKLPELIQELVPGEELLLTVDGQPVARITPTSEAPTERKLGTMAGTVLDMVPDFYAPLDDFREYSS